LHLQAYVESSEWFGNFKYEGFALRFDFHLLLAIPRHQRMMIAKSENPDYPVTVLDQTAMVLMPEMFTVNQAVSFKQAFQSVCQDIPTLTQAKLDFHQTTFIDSSGIGALISALKTAQQQHVHLKLVNVSSQVMMALSMTDLDKIFEIEQSTHITEAIKARPAREQQPQPTHPSVTSTTKRVIDIIGALVGLAITAVLFIPIAIAIQIDNPGPLFFGQVRCSWMGKRFKMWKFRSMVVNAEALKSQVENQVSGPLFKNANDPRITRVGRFLRRTSLDELPQFLNVLRGEMSLVGTRPPTPDEIEMYEIPQWQRLDVKPGMTGEWQVNGRSSVKSFEDVIQLDLKYQQNWSLWYDIQLIFKTIAVLFNKKSGAM
jgi:anti-anti-sigma factor